MRYVNRSSLVVRPKAPYIQWAGSMDGGETAAEDLQDHFSVYLVAEDPRGQQESAPVRAYYREIFEAELLAWHTDPQDWPKDRSYQAFEGWFQVEANSITIDLEHSALEVEEIEEE